MAAMFGGVVGQEVMKAASGKFHPLFQFFYFDSIESLPDDDLTPEQVAPQVCYSNFSLITKKVFTSVCPFSEVPLHSECGNWFPVLTLGMSLYLKELIQRQY